MKEKTSKLIMHVDVGEFYRSWRSIAPPQSPLCVSSAIVRKADRSVLGSQITNFRGPMKVFDKFKTDEPSVRDCVLGRSVRSCPSDVNRETNSAIRSNSFDLNRL
jgi:hypothetical protein